VSLRGSGFKHLRFLRLLPGPPRTFHTGALSCLAECGWSRLPRDHLLLVAAVCGKLCLPAREAGKYLFRGAAEEVANSPRNRHRKRPYGWVTNIVPNEQGREGAAAWGWRRT
jgi:hypothetical protein